MKIDVIDKARKLLALRDRAGTPAEAAAAARALAKLIDKHRIGIAELEAKSETKEQCAIDRSEPLLQWRRLERHRRSLCSALCEHYGVAWWQSTVAVGRNGRGNIYHRAVHLCGRPSDIAIVRYMYTWLSVEVERLGNKKRRAIDRKSFKLGIVLGIQRQLRELRCEVEQEHGLVLSDRAGDALAALRRAIKLSTLRSSSTMVSRQAYDDGFRAGKNLHLGERLERGPTKSLGAAT